LSEFAVTVHRLHLEPHPNADRILIGSVFGQAYQFVVGNDRVEAEMGAYIPEGAVLPIHLIEEMELVGKLAGSAHNRVRAIKLRGVLSQGLWYPIDRRDPSFESVIVGDDLTDSLGIEKYEQPIPIHMAGKIKTGPASNIWRHYDIENIKRYPDVIADGEMVVITEKLHGSFCAVGIVGGERVVTSKGYLSRGLVIVEDDDNVYWRTVKAEGLHEKLASLLVSTDSTEVLLFGEVCGVQDLKYGLSGGKTFFRAFDLLAENGDERGSFQFIPMDWMEWDCEQENIPMVPILYGGPFSAKVLAEHTSGKSTLADHIREGVVVQPMVPRYESPLGRVILKSVSEQYLLRKGETTEYE